MFLTDWNLVIWGKLKAVSGASSGLDAYAHFFFFLVQSERVMGSKRDAEEMTRLPICHACHAFLRILSAHA